MRTQVTILAVFVAAFAAASVHLWAYPAGLGAVAPYAGAMATVSVIAVGFLAGRATGRISWAAVTWVVTVAALASAWAVVKVVDPARPEGEMILIAWSWHATLVGGGHVAGALSVDRRAARGVTP